MLRALLQKILLLNIIAMQIRDNQIRGRIHWDFLMSSAFQGLATRANLRTYSNMIPCKECKDHFTEWLSQSPEERFIWSKAQVDALYNLYTQIQQRKQETDPTVEIKDWQERFLFYYKRIW